MATPDKTALIALKNQFDELNTKIQAAQEAGELSRQRLQAARQHVPALRTQWREQMGLSGGKLTAEINQTLAEVTGAEDEVQRLELVTEENQNINISLRAEAEEARIQHTNQLATVRNNEVTAELESALTTVTGAASFQPFMNALGKYLLLMIEEKRGSLESYYRTGIANSTRNIEFHGHKITQTEYESVLAELENVLSANGLVVPSDFGPELAALPEAGHQATGYTGSSPLARKKAIKKSMAEKIR